MSLLKFPKTNLYDTVHMYYYFIKYFGYAPFTIVGNIKNGKIKITPLDLIIYVTYLTTNLIVLYMGFQFQFDMKTSVLLVFGMKLVVFLSVFIGVIATTWNLFNGKSMWKIISNLNEIDETLKSFNWPLNHQRHFNILLLYTFINACYMAIAVTTSFSHHEITVLRVVLYMVPNTSFSMIMGVYNMYLLAISSRCRAFNKCFKHIFNQNESTSQQVKIIKADINYLVDLLPTLSLLHDKLNDTVELLNFCFSFQVMLCIGLSFTYTIFSIFFVYRLLIHFSGIELMFAISRIVWTFYYVGYVLSVITLGSWIAREGKYTSILIHKTINTIDDKSVIEKLRLFSQQIIHRIPILTCGLFPFDWTLFYSICAASTTYLVILIQFDASMAATSITTNLTNNSTF